MSSSGLTVSVGCSTTCPDSTARSSCHCPSQANAAATARASRSAAIHFGRTMVRGSDSVCGGAGLAACRVSPEMSVLLSSVVGIRLPHGLLDDAVEVGPGRCSLCVFGRSLPAADGVDEVDLLVEHWVALL